MACEQRQHYWDGRLDGAELRAFERHLTQCAACRDAVAAWRAAAARIVREDAARWEHRVVAPAERQRDALVAAARRRRVRSTGTGSRRWMAVAAVAVGCACAGWWAVREWGAARTDPSHPRLARSAVAAAEPVEEAPPRPARTLRFSSETAAVSGGDDRLEGGAHGRCFAVENDVMCLSAGGVGTVRRTREQRRFEVERGGVVCAVRTEEGRPFAVTAGGVEVVVTGTRFLVAVQPQGGVRVGVERGSVSVRRGPWRGAVAAGRAVDLGGDGTVSWRGLAEEERAAFAAVAPALRRLPDREEGRSRSQKPSPVAGGAPRKRVASAPPGDLAVWRRMLADGDVDGAVAGLERYVRAHPEDGEAGMVLATAYRRAGRLEDAWALWRRWADADAAVSLRAAYMAGRLAVDMGRYDQALPYLEKCVARSGGRAPFWPEARFAQAKALSATGRTEQAAFVLRDLVKRYGRMEVGRRAAAMLRAVEEAP